MCKLSSIIHNSQRMRIRRMIKAINIETEEQFEWMVREMRGLNNPDNEK